MKKTFLLFIVISLFNAISCLAQANEQLETEKFLYMDAFESNAFLQMKDVIDKMQWQGISDEDIYDAMLAQFKKTRLSTNKIALSQTAYFARGLALSGNEKYKKVIESALAKKPHKSLIEPYEEALKLFDKYALWNPVISANLESAKNIHLQRLKNMLTSDYPELIAQGAKGVYRLYYNDADFVAMTAERLKSIYASANDEETVKAAELLCKVISRSGMSQYKALLLKVAETAESKKLRKAAQEYADNL